MKCNVKYEDDKMMVQSDYNKQFVDFAHNMHGKWQNNSWVFDKELADDVEKALKDIFGYGDETVNILIKIKANGEIMEGLDYNHGTILLKGVQICRRAGRDWAVKMAESAYLVSGDFGKSGGSVKNPTCIGYGSTDDITIKFLGFPKSKFEAIEDKTNIEVI